MSAIRKSFVADLHLQVGTSVTLRGWVYHLRVLSKTTFVILKDCSGEAQCVAATEVLREMHLKLDDAIEIRGTVRRDARAK
ncbi:MAG TPA: OB-fold nucleic acid binding domain-containing protein, partial [Terriglobia bacterium]|nr:OB-fold nucleic acid binding domain-containing protein [Terriglobia bacterium]